MSQAAHLGIGNGIHLAQPTVSHSHRECLTCEVDLPLTSRLTVYRQCQLVEVVQLLTSEKKHGASGSRRVAALSSPSALRGEQNNPSVTQDN